MTGKFRLGKMSIFMRVTASALPTTMPIMATMTVIGCRRAKTIGFMLMFLRARGASEAESLERALLMALAQAGDAALETAERGPQSPRRPIRAASRAPDAKRAGRWRWRGNTGGGGR